MNLRKGMKNLAGKILKTETQQDQNTTPQPKKEFTAMIAVTYRCQCRCEHCGSGFYVKDKDTELTTKELNDLMADFAKIGATSTSYFGGEPMLRKDLPEIIHTASSLGMGTVVDTNAVAITEEKAKILAEAGLNVASISLDTTIPEKHDKFRGVPGTWQNAVNAIKLCKANGIEPHISTYVDREKLNNGEFADLLKLGKDLGAKVRVLAPVLAGRWCSEESFKLTPDEIQRMKSMLVPGESFWEQPSCNGADKGFFCAATKKNMLYVTAYGDVCPCAYIPLSFGNIRKEPLEDIVKRMWEHKMFSKPDFNDCPMNNPEFKENFGKKFRNATHFPVPEN